MKQFDYITHGTCSQLIHITLNDDNRIEEVTFLGGCNGNLKGIGALIRGQKPEDVIARLKVLRVEQNRQVVLINWHKHLNK